MSISEAEAPTAPPPVERPTGNTLKAGELNLFDSTAVAVSSVAPAYSLAATMTLLFVIPGVAFAGPAVILVSFVPVLFIAVAYFHLNRKDPDCGASYSWLSKLISPYFGWFNGWVQVATSVLFCVSAPILAGAYTLTFASSQNWISQATATSPGWTAIVGAAWLALVTFICVWGIRWTTNFQWIMVIIEYVAVVVFSIWGIVKVLVSHPAGSRVMQWSWFNPFSIKGISALTAGAVLGVFFFWGWDTAVNLNEESKESTKNPGRAGVISMFLLLFVFLINIVAAQMLLTPAQYSAQSGAILFYFANHAVGSWAGYVMIIAVLSSTVGTTQTTLLPAARVTLSMARDKVFPHPFATIQGKLQTPAVGTLIIAFVCLFGILLTTESHSVSAYFTELINDIGVLIAFYYGVTGITCAWAFRRVAFKKPSFFLLGILAPFLSGVALLYIGYKVFAQNWSTPTGNQSIPILIVLALGIPLVAIARFTTKGPFFKTKVISYDSIE